MHNVCERMFEHEQIIGLDIGEDYFCAVLLMPGANGTKRIARTVWQERTSRPSLRENAKNLRSFLKANGLTVHTAAVCFCSHAIHLKHFRYANVARAELSSALTLEAEELTQRPADELCIDWHLYDCAAPGPKPPLHEGILAVALKQDVSRHLELLALAGLYTVIVDIGPMALANLLQECIRVPADAAVSAAFIGSNAVDFSIIDEGGFILPRQFFSYTTPWTGNPAELIDDIAVSLKFYHYKLKRHQVKTLYLCGPLAADRTLVAKLSEHLPVSVETWDPLVAFLTPEQAPVANAASYACALGLILHKGESA